MVATPRIVQASSYRNLVVIVPLALLLLGAAVWFSYDHGRSQADGSELVLLEENSSQAKYIQDLEAEKSRLREKVAALERSSQIDREATKLVREELKQLQDERMKQE
ncbi:MAG: hypothetical protein ABW120_14500, partial [Sedimenticola sp.]